MAEIRIRDTDYTLGDGITVVGRGEDADIRIEHGGLSRMHMRFAIAGDTVEMEDLGSKNGTYVNGNRIEEKVALVRGDKLRIADLDCEIKYPAPEEPAEPKAAGPPPAPSHKAARKEHVRKKGEMKMIKNVAAGAVAVILLLAGYSFLKGYVSPELRRARQTIATAKAYLDQAEVGDDFDANDDMIDQINRLKEDLEDISPDFAEEERLARKLLSRAKELRKQAAARNDKLRNYAAGLKDLEKIEADYAAGVVGPDFVLASLDYFLLEYKGTEVENRARALMSRARTAAFNAEKALLAQAAVSAGELRQAGKFKAAGDILDTCLAQDFVFLQPTDLESLTELKSGIRKEADTFFKHLIDKALAEARTGDADEARKTVELGYEAVGLNHLKPEFERALAQIKSIYAERLRKAREKVASEMSQAEGYEKSRQFHQALALYISLKSKVDEPVLQKELSRRVRLNTVMTGALNAVIGYIKSKGEVAIEGVGKLSQASPEGFTIANEGMAMQLKWSKLQRGEYMGLHVKTLLTKPEPALLMACAIFLIEAGKGAEGDAYLVRASNARPEYRDEFPAYYEALGQRKKARAEEAARRAAAAEAARKARIIAQWTGVGPRGPVGPRKKNKKVRTLNCSGNAKYEDFIVDGKFGKSDLVDIRGKGATLRYSEIMNSQRDGVEVYADDVTIEFCKLHHFISSTFKKQHDAHCITGRANNLTIRDCEMYYMTGDGVQLDPNRKPWDNLLIENCFIWTGPLPEDAAGFKAGESPGENAFDSKQHKKNPRSRVIIRNCVFKGWRGTNIDNVAAINIKDNVHVTVEGCVFVDCEIGIRVRGPGTFGGSEAVLRENVFYNCDTAIRIEDKIQNLKIYDTAFGAGVKQRYAYVEGGYGKGFECTGSKKAPKTWEQAVKTWGVRPKPAAPTGRRGR